PGRVARGSSRAADTTVRNLFHRERTCGRRFRRNRSKEPWPLTSTSSLSLFSRSPEQPLTSLAWAPELPRSRQRSGATIELQVAERGPLIGDRATEITTAIWCDA